MWVDENITPVKKELKPLTNKLVFDYRTASDCNEFRHAQKVIEELGITYDYLEGMPVLDSMVFYNCKNIPNELPKYIYRH